MDASALLKLTSRGRETSVAAISAISVTLIQKGPPGLYLSQASAGYNDMSARLRNTSPPRFTVKPRSYSRISSKLSTSQSLTTPPDAQSPLSGPLK